MSNSLTQSVTEITEAYKTSTSRSRYTFFLLNIASVLLLISFFNAEFSWTVMSEKPTLLNYSSDTKDKVMLWMETFKDADSVQYNELKKIVADPSGIIAISNKILSDKTKRDTTYKKDATRVEDHAKDSFQIPILSITIFIQDLPILGGLAILTLLVWFYYTRRRATGILREMKNMLKKETLTADEKRKLVYTISFNSVFNTVNHVDKDYQAPVHIKTNLTFNLMNLAPIIILSVIFFHNVFENHICGEENQCILKKGKYDANKLEHQYLMGAEILQYSKEIPAIKYLIKTNIDTYHFIDFALDNDLTKATMLKWYILITEGVGLIILMLCIFFMLNIMKLSDRDDYYTAEIDKATEEIFYSR